MDQYQSSLKSELELILSPDLARHEITSLDLLQTPRYATARDHVAKEPRFAQLKTYLLSLFGVRQEPERETPAVAAAAAAVTDPEMTNAVKIFQQSFWAQNEKA